MKTTVQNILGVALSILMPLSANAQDAYAEMERAEKNVEQMLEAAGAFMGDVRFNEYDVTSLINLWGEWNEIGNTSEDEDDEFIDFESIIKDSEYRQWAASHDLDADAWLRKTMRISLSLYRQEMLAAAEAMPEQIREQLDMIEQQRHQLGEELFLQMKQGLEATAQYSTNIAESFRHLPETTAEERALLDQYRGELMMMMNSDDEDYDDYSEFENYEADDYEE